jgi:hypothetical protein
MVARAFASLFFHCSQLLTLALKKAGFSISFESNHEERLPRSRLTISSRRLDPR